jgi:Zn finger protein HypA/HybF involved in hydrogenase expression
MTVHPLMPTPLNRTLDQELAAILRGVSLECPVCGEFLLHVQGVLACPECRSLLCDRVLGEGEEFPEIELPSVVQAG